MPLPALTAKALPMLSKAFNSRGAQAAGALGGMIPGGGGQGGGAQPPGLQAFQQSIIGRLMPQLMGQGQGQAPGVES